MLIQESAFATSNRLARAVDRTRIVARELGGFEPDSPDSAAHISTGCGIAIVTDASAAFGLAFGYVLMVRELARQPNSMWADPPSHIATAVLWAAKLQLAWRAKIQSGEFPVRCVRAYPLTLIFENESTALPEVGLPIDVAGRKVVKMSMFFTCGSRDLVSSGFDRIR